MTDSGCEQVPTVILRGQASAPAEVLRAFAAHADSRLLVMAGDFNAEPGQLDRVRSRPRGGRFADVDAADNQATFYRAKIDYVFLPERGLRDLSGTVESSDYSDHRILLGRADLKS